ncbi:hypothetical protein FA743_07610 [Paracoccus gahaiensis]|uniref:Zinc finger/thioredoxin putative domain-containing protein n=1 Tax=Paracoccus gahaiensis TaxID=1706839 RepID=A0A4U0RCA5_9RHOB|nr:zinc-ribbon domain-containing protein [Paracoccus gahaiensis]TJZ92717.1 hypothetical protein FA743_07610 [Paracoccus gahaiensis]
MAEIELICPGCGADYALPDGAIPPAGREVECSRCGHVWQATPPAPEGPLDLGRYTRVAGVAGPRPAAQAPVAGRSAKREQDEDDRPADIPLPPASKRLSPDLLDLLRGEVDREKRLREAEAGGAKGEEVTAGEAGIGATGTGARADAGPAVPPDIPDQDDNGISHAAEPGDEIDWPATTVTLPAGSSRSMTPMAQPPVLLTPAPEPMPVSAPATVLLTPKPRPEPERAAMPVRRAEPSPRPAPAIPRPGLSPTALAANLRADGSASDRAPQAARRPAPAAPERGPTAYRLGLGIAALLVAAVVAVYLLAPVVQPQDGAVAQTLTAWRSDLDLARLWLDAQLRPLIP